ACRRWCTTKVCNLSYIRAEILTQSIIALHIVNALNWFRPTTKQRLKQPARDLMGQTFQGHEDTKDRAKMSATRSSREHSMVPVSCSTSAPMPGVKRTIGSLSLITSF